jgi:hypothetical protein
MKKKVQIRLGVRREIIRMLDERARATVIGGQRNCSASQVGSSCTTAILEPPRED